MSLVRLGKNLHHDNKLLKKGDVIDLDDLDVEDEHEAALWATGVLIKLTDDEQDFERFKVSHGQGGEDSVKRVNDDKDAKILELQKIIEQLQADKETADAANRAVAIDAGDTGESNAADAASAVKQKKEQAQQTEGVK